MKYWRYLSFITIESIIAGYVGGNDLLMPVVFGNTISVIILALLGYFR